jgi:hypothetical protein
MDKSSKEPKRGTIRSFFNSCNVKNRSSTFAIPHNTTDSLSHKIVDMSSTSTTHVAEIASVWAINRDFAKY